MLKSFTSFSIFTLFLLLSNSSYVFGQKPLRKPPRLVRPAPAPSRSQSSLRLTVTGTLDGHSYVDLGLSVKWATCNVGADSPEKYGDHFAWGETAPKNNYTSENCKSYGVQLSDISGYVQYDAARSNWGGSWCLPTKKEFKELEENCDMRTSTHNGVKGYLVTSKKNGNCIFLPAAGGWHGTSSTGVGIDGFYWSSSLDEDDDHFPYSIIFHCSDIGFGLWRGREVGRSVRAVHRKDKVKLSSIRKDLLKKEESIAQQSQMSDPMNSKVDSLKDEPKLLSVSGMVDNYSYVDLGLSVKWATCNVGANSPEKYGDYFAWGEIASKSIYSLINRKLLCEELNDISGNVNYDAARSNLGGSWRLPTLKEFIELVDNCIFTWTVYNSVKGYLVTSSKNGNCIFLPAAGYRNERSLSGAGSYGCYLSATRSPFSIDLTYGLSFYSYEGVRFNKELRCFDGNSVRPVHD